MRAIRFFLFFFLLLATSYGARASHLVGGEMSYRCLGNNKYEVTLIIYRDCFSGQALLDQSVQTTIYNSSNQIIYNTRMPLFHKYTLPIKAPNNCTSFPRNICTEKGIYKDTFNLPPIVGGYTITHQRCCRNATISNIPNPSFLGTTFTASIPSMDSCNSLPKFNSDPPVALCINQPVQIDLSATDPDGDSLYYELCQLYTGGGRSNGMEHPNPAGSPPYTVINYQSGFSINNPIPSNPAFSLNPNTGILSGRPTQAGQFVFVVCVSEYRNGVLLGTNRRDFQFNVSNSCWVTISWIADQEINPQNICSGGQIQFENLSQDASNFFWDFGDTTTLADTSHQKNPSYFYQDTGRYTVMLIADPGSSCADTSYKVFRVFDSIYVDFIYTGQNCLEGNSYDFFPSGTYSSDAEFLWDFGTSTNQGTTSKAKSPKAIVFPEEGLYYVKLTVSDHGCANSYERTVRIYPNPRIDEKVEPATVCLPYTVRFEDETEAWGPVQHFWFFGDGTSSNLPNPEHTYERPGTFTVRHMIKTSTGCLDSAYSVYPDVITVLPTPRTRLDIYPRETSIYNPYFSVSNYSEEDSYTETFLPDGRKLRDMSQEQLVMKDTGTYLVTQVSYNKFGCTDSVVDTIRVTSPFNLHIPTAFTPNSDGVNDEFYYTATDVRKADLYIFNRWGEIVYQSNDMYARWNGRKMNRGEILPADVYTYVLLLNVKKGGYTHREEGTITLIR